jgi:DnaJ-class molecular chaperone
MELRGRKGEPVEVYVDAHDLFKQAVGIGGYWRASTEAGCFVLSRVDGPPVRLHADVNEICERYELPSGETRYRVRRFFEDDLLGVLSPCPDCRGRGGQMFHTYGSRAPDPQTEQLCDRCEGTGVEGLVGAT